MKKMIALAIVLPLAPLSVYACRLLQEKRSAVPQNYDVFLSFKVPDTRTCFTNFLYNSQVAAGFYVFRDDDSIPVGEQIGQEKLRAIKSCRFMIPIISEQYAQSKWCLRELTKIVDCHRKHGKSVFPVFYKADVGDVRCQRVNFERALRKPEMPISAEEMEKWWNALTSVARIKGWISQTIANGHEAELVIMVVAKVSSDLKAMWIEWLPMFISSGIRVFNDDDPSLIGKDVDHEICNAIDHCKISIPILSEDYASSCWCLDELAQMVECKRTKRQKILPIIYKVRTMHVRDLSGVFGEKILKHEKLVDESTYEQCKRALKEVGSFKGWVSERIATGHEGVLVKEVVEEVSRLLKNPQTNDPLSLATEY